MDKLSTKEEFDDSALMAYQKWEKYCEQIKAVNRFFVDEEFNQIFLDIIKENKRIIEKGSILYRARINEFGQTKPYPNEKMGAPDRSTIIAGNGRANPTGITYLYTSGEKNTCIAELRPSIGNDITVGTFEVLEDLNVITLDHSFISNSQLYSIFAIYLSIGFASPIDHSKANLEYLPTQYFAELVKKQGYDGLRFISHVTSSERGRNVIIFNPDLARCISTESFKISGIQYSTSPAI